MTQVFNAIKLIILYSVTQNVQWTTNDWQVRTWIGLVIIICALVLSEAFLALYWHICNAGVYRARMTTSVSQEEITRREAYYKMKMDSRNMWLSEK